MRFTLSLLFFVTSACAIEDSSDVNETELVIDRAHSELSQGQWDLVGNRSVYRGPLRDVAISPLGAATQCDPVSGQCAICYPADEHSFDFTYRNQSLPWGVKLTLVRGMYGQGWCGGCDPPIDGFFEWGHAGEDELTSVGPWTWAADSTVNGYDGAMGGQLLAIRFVVRIEYPDGTVHWDNGGSITGYYQAEVAKLECDLSAQTFTDHETPEHDLAVSTVYK